MKIDLQLKNYLHLSIFSWGTAVNKTVNVIKNPHLDDVLADLHEAVVLEKVLDAHDKGFDSFESSNVQVARLISVWISLQKL